VVTSSSPFQSACHGDEDIAGPKHFQSFPQLGHEPAIRVHPEDWHRALTPFVRTVE
jgi:hypothetical protein